MSVPEEGQLLQQASECSQRVFGIAALRDYQVPPIEAALRRERFLMLSMGTGAGKSLCFQLAAIMTRERLGRGTTLVVLPSKTIIDDQVDGLAGRVQVGVLHGDVDWIVKDRLLIDVISRDEGPPLVYTTTDSFMSLLKDHTDRLAILGRLHRVVLDEVHEILLACDYRPVMKKLRNLAIDSRVPLTLSSASLRQRDLERVVTLLGIEPGKLSVYEGPAVYPERHYTFVDVGSGNVTTRMKYLSQVLNSRDVWNEQGIVFCATSEVVAGVVERICDMFGGKGDKRVAAGVWATMTESDGCAKEIVEAWKKGDVRILVCTIGYGTGVHKSDVRFCVLYDPSRSPESIYQFLGRIGRDGLRADVLVLFGWKDLQRAFFNTDKTRNKRERTLLTQDAKEDARQALERLMALVGILVNAETCRHETLRSYFGHRLTGERECRQDHYRCDICKVKASHTLEIRRVGGNDVALAVLDTVQTNEQTEKFTCTKKLAQACVKGHNWDRTPPLTVVKAVVERMLCLDVLRAIPKTTKWSNKIEIEKGSTSIQDVETSVDVLPDWPLFSSLPKDKDLQSYAWEARPVSENKAEGNENLEEGQDEGNDDDDDDDDDDGDGDGDDGEKELLRQYRGVESAREGGSSELEQDVSMDDQRESVAGDSASEDVSAAPVGRKRRQLWFVCPQVPVMFSDCEDVDDDMSSLPGADLDSDASEVASADKGKGVDRSTQVCESSDLPRPSKRRRSSIGSDGEVSAGVGSAPTDPSFGVGVGGVGSARLDLDFDGPLACPSSASGSGMASSSSRAPPASEVLSDAQQQKDKDEEALVALELCYGEQLSRTDIERVRHAGPGVILGIAQILRDQQL